MQRLYNSITDLVGQTPLLALRKFSQYLNLKATIAAKLEFFNPAGSIKDRIALAMIEAAEQSGELRPGSILVEPTSGNTGIGLAEIAAAKGYRLILVMPDSMSMERRRLMQAYGANVVTTPGSEGMQGAIARAKELVAENPGSLLVGQFTNPANPEAHFKNTGPEIWRATEGKIDFFVAGVGTGGTITGVGQYLKSRKKNVKIIAVEPSASPVLSGGRAGPHALQGIGAGFVPEVLDTKIIDKIIKVANEDAMAYARLLGRTEGVLTGYSGGAALWASAEVAREHDDALIVTILPDGGDRYLSTTLYADA